jgi:hypothetical protein
MLWVRRCVMRIVPCVARRGLWVSQIGRTPPLSSDKAKSHFPALHRLTGVPYSEVGWWRCGAVRLLGDSCLQSTSSLPLSLSPSLPLSLSPSLPLSLSPSLPLSLSSDGLFRRLQLGGQLWARCSKVCPSLAHRLCCSHPPSSLAPCRSWPVAGIGAVARAHSTLARGTVMALLVSIFTLLFALGTLFA